MDLRRRLEQVAGIDGVSSTSSQDAGSAAHPQPPLESLVDGRWISRPQGRCFVAEEHFELDHMHGGLYLGDALKIDASQWGLFAVGLTAEPFDLREALFIDTETTGLGRDASTFAFMIGLGFFEGDRFCVRQHFMPDYGHELALLDLVGDVLAARNGLVSFNGRSFDWPIIRIRYILAQQDLPSSGEPHLDLLHAARRLWRRRLSSCALSALEADVLDVQRTDADVPGYLIPQLYQEYVTHGRTRPMAQVFYHNAVDLLSLVTLAARIGRTVSAPEDPECLPFCDDVALGRLYEAMDQPDAAIEAYRRGCECVYSDDRALAHRYLSFLLKRMGRLDEAMDVWQRCLGSGEIYPYEELAKQYEHRLKDYRAAREIVLAAMNEIHQRAQIDHRGRDELHDLQHRLDRLERRIARR